MTEPLAFTCPDCGCRVYTWGRADRTPERCGVCEWIAEYVTDPDEAATLRARLQD